VVLFGLLLTGPVYAAAPCSQSTSPDFPATTPIKEHADKRLSRETVRYISDTAKYIACLRADTSLGPERLVSRNSVLNRTSTPCLWLAWK
jgi:hypothetical protein